MGQNRSNERSNKQGEAPPPGTPEPAREWGKETAKSPDDFPGQEAAAAEQPRRRKSTEPEDEAHRREGREESHPMDRPAPAEHDPAWEGRVHLDPKRDPHGPGPGGAARDAVGQADRGSIDQTITDKGYTETR
jgi:hypothetical protein